MLKVDAPVNHLACRRGNLIFELLENDRASLSHAKSFDIFAVRGVVGS